MTLSRDDFDDVEEYAETLRFRLMKRDNDITRSLSLADDITKTINALELEFNRVGSKADLQDILCPYLFTIHARIDEFRDIVKPNYTTDEPVLDGRDDERITIDWRDYDD